MSEMRVADVKRLLPSIESFLRVIRVGLMGDERLLMTLRAIAKYDRWNVTN